MVDDVQWAEATALALLRHLARALAGAPILLVVSRRDPGEPASDELRAALADIERTESRHLDLEGLGETELAELVVAASRAAPDAELRAVTAKLRDDTAGNPLYVGEVVREGKDIDRSVELFHRVNQQDFEACERCQPAMSSRRYAAGGVLVPSEHHIAEFHDWVRARLA